ncbi:DMT family transporter [Shimia sp. R10_1]|uniref:DMT family transporter n=1 Tax=Shimia sp. R10_1 TaxID=2821095 RepID=UPI001ADAEED8|nr:DMT family transporter [Shimia sp. R10_1]MBO9472407.1 DMT family transporter [Shimia sp. R10_1]
MRRDVSLGPVGLLIWCGTLLGVGFPLSKVSFAAGVSPMMWALLVSMGASLSLLPVLGVRGLLRLPRGRMLRYVVISGLVSFAGINLMIFALVPKLGAGQVGMMFALSPVATLALSVLFGMKAPGRLGLWGIGMGLIGALLVAFGRGGVEGTLWWSLAGLAIPLILAAGNVYRTLDWPAGAHPMALAFWSHGVAIVALVAAMLWQGDGVPLATLSAVPWAAGVQALAAALTFPAYFRLQKLGGPVLLSQIGYVAAAVGLVVGVALLGERYGPVSWIGAATTVVGISFSVYSQGGGLRTMKLPMPLGRKTRARIGTSCYCYEEPKLNRVKVM